MVAFSGEVEAKEGLEGPSCQDVSEAQSHPSCEGPQASVCREKPCVQPGLC